MPLSFDFSPALGRPDLVADSVLARLRQCGEASEAGWLDQVLVRPIDPEHAAGNDIVTL